jgi:glyoxylase-like metal-dependent hydrolase (beta-lactamase superfamily II)/rhodanese-related sulfurtransferase
MNAFLFRQLYDNSSSTYTYLLADEKNREAVVIDPVFELHHRDLALIKELGLNLKFVLDTHCHADHVTGAWLMKKATGCKTVLSKQYAAQNVDLPVNEGDQIRFGGHALRVIATPGHTSGCLTYALDNDVMAFTGDSLMIRSAGRTDFQEGSASKMYASIHDKLFGLPDDCLIYPAHDYDGRCVSTIGEEKKFNVRAGQDANENDFVGYMKNLHLPHPKKIDIAVPANMKCGRPEKDVYPKLAEWGPVEQNYDGVPQIAASWVCSHLDRVFLVDVRDQHEFASLPAIEGAHRVPLSDLAGRLAEIPKNKPVVTVCRSGTRSAQATAVLKKNGYPDAANMKGGMLAWKELFP